MSFITCRGVLVSGVSFKRDSTVFPTVVIYLSHKQRIMLPVSLYVLMYSVCLILS